ncbi:hypothetical protein [Jonesia denitrificans]|uniref:Uncharacterized protein n=1 Tax=Jonesia denitrificans (strain ATCC 14870 / DSM 20603 / BCRC 15368 / CIP 55.134 / JCM 11481 / NBRC 15587 / NCTC 10816 / Prevot 55134) TaxID=471856 RepID=C7R4Z9_JONDD|nr:hypothetical protein [Jonesia denitrificans]ACV09169.1 hypothetical protein Jden_1521 [Jonesia denitrificans DSM 20603]ASE09555.1 hypothetical protein CEP80_10735 [Jonesia denitrificans]QXB44098.1 hypothetical protein I6L70_04370 [Jonesia denitrificans]SQH21397.1 Uncharacterised protein [Jonesia denitrificans]
MLFTRSTLPRDIASRARTLSRPPFLAWMRDTPHSTSQITATTRFLIATRSHLVLITENNAEQASPTPSSSAVSPDGDNRWEWSHVDRASWDPTDQKLTVTFTTSTEPLTVTASTDTPVRFLTVLRERIEHTVVMSETITLDNSRNVRIALRRTPNGDTFIEVLHDRNAPPTDHEIRTKVTPVVARFRELSGAPLKTC